MKSKSINDLVRERIRQLRLTHGMGVTEVASKAGLPVSSYASLETGAYRITLDNLFRILGALEVDIDEVWPAEVTGAAVTNEKLYFKRIQEFRLSEVIHLSDAEGGGLFALHGQKCSVLMSFHLSDFLLDRLILSLEERRAYPGGKWFRHKFKDTRFFLFLKAETCPDYVAAMIRSYMINWSALFGEILSGNGT